MILVTGASGTVGSEVVKVLRAGGARVRAAYRTRPQNVPEGVEAVALDYDRRETIPRALEDVETVFLLSNAVEPERNVVDEARRARVKRIVKLSVFGAPRKEFTFARWHRRLEEHVEASGLAWTFLRPNSFMQNVITYMGDTIRKESAIYSSAGDGAVAHVDVRDIARVAARALTERGHEGKAYELTGPEALTYGRVADVLGKVLGRPVKYVRITHDQYRQGALASGMPEAYADALVDLERFYEAGKAAQLRPTVREVTGRDPIRFEQFARDYASALG